MSTIDGSVKKFKFLQTFLAGNNNLRGLDKVVKVLSKLTCLERVSNLYLDLYGNPCAEEPYYRQKVIASLPNLKIFDRHGKIYIEIALAERLRSETIVARLQETAGPKMVKPPKKPGLSTGEKDLAREIKDIKAKKVRLVLEAERNGITEFGWDKFKEAPAPIATKVKQNYQNFGLCPEERVSEWEKNEIKKIFWNYDKDKSGNLDFEEMGQLLRDIKENKAGIGKIPVDEVSALIDQMKAWERLSDSKIHWREFRDGMNLFKWRLCDSDVLEQEIKALYAKAKKEEMNGRNDSAKMLSMQALRLQGLDTRTKPIMPSTAEIEKPKFKTDTFFVYKFKESLRDVGVKTIYNSSKPLDLQKQALIL